MYNTTKQCQEVLGSSSRSFAAFFIPENETTEYREIKSVKISAMSSSDGQITIGDTSSKRIEIMAIADSKLTEGQKIYVYESVKLDDGTYQDIPMGKYTITSLTERGGITTIEGAGALSVEAYTAYFSKLTYPSDTVSMLKEISVIIGIPINVDNLTPILFEKKPEGYICREIIGYIAALYGKNAVEERDGSISLKWYEHQKTDIFSDRTELPELKKSDFVVNKLQCDVSPEVSYTKGSGTGITISNPFMTKAIMENVWQQIQGYTYRPAEINVKSGNPCIDQWDSYSYGIYNIICACIEHKYDGGVQNTITSHGESETEADIGFKGPTAIVLERYAAEFVLVNEALVHKLSVDEADIKYLKSAELTTIEADIKNAIIGSLSAEFATVDYLEANYAQLNLANVEKATIGTVLADVGLITEATIVNGHVTGYLDSVNINANSITAGDLSVERLIMRGNENSVVYALNNITGALQAQNVDTINGEVLTKRTVTADRLVAKSITASEIAAGTLTANEINVANIFGNSAVLNTLISQSAFINAVSANSVVVGAGKSAELAKKMANGKLMHNDAMFMNGDNGVAVYNQLHNGNVTVTRVLKSSYNMTSCPTTSNYIIRIQTTGAASPKHGGFVRSFYSRPNAVFIIKYLINLPKGYYLKAASNSMGTGFVDEFIGNTEGTGTWKEYYRMTTCGETGSFSTGGYVYIEGSKTPTSSSPLVWYLGAIYTYDVTDANPIDGWLYQDTTLIDGGKIYTGTVIADAIAANAVTTAKLAANAVTADKLSVSSLSAITANLGTVTAGTIKMKNVEDKTAYITYEDKGGYSNQIGAYGMTLHADRENTSVGAGYMIMQAQYDEAAIVISRYATDYSTDIAPGWGMFSHRLSVGGYNNTAYALSAKSIIAQSIVTESGANLSDINDRLKNLTFYADTATTPSATGSYKAIRTLPSGFTVNNTYIISIMIQRSDTAAWQAMDGQISAYIADTHLYVYVGNSFWANRPMKILFARR